MVTQNTASRTIAIGDIHGCAKALDALIDAIKPGPNETIVTLGNHIDRGPNSKAVVDRLIGLGKRSKLVPLMGDHEEMILDALGDVTKLESWFRCSGKATLRSYGWQPGSAKRALKDWLPERHQQFLSGCQLYHETHSHQFVHAGYIPNLPINKQPASILLRWNGADVKRAKPHSSGKVTVVGHTAQLTGEVLDLGFLICIDTNCARGGWLTALDTDTGRIWQADIHGRLRMR